ncbi:MAG: hypothetical protein R2850_04820 [Bacteroidia bacterium]
MSRNLLVLFKRNYLQLKYFEKSQTYALVNSVFNYKTSENKHQILLLDEKFDLKKYAEYKNREIKKGIVFSNFSIDDAGNVYLVHLLADQVLHQNTDFISKVLKVNTTYIKMYVSVLPAADKR